MLFAIKQLHLPPVWYVWPVPRMSSCALGGAIQLVGALCLQYTTSKGLVTIVRCNLARIPAENVWFHTCSALSCLDPCFFWPRHYYAVSVGLEGEAGKEEGFTDCQYQELMNLISSLKTKYNIKGWNVLGLEEVCMPPGRYTSPGRYFDWSRISPVTFNVDSARGLPEGSAAPTLRQLMEDWGYGLGLPEDDATFQQRLQIFQHRYEVDAEDENASRAASQRKLSALIHARSLHNSGLWRCCAGIGLILVALLMARFRRLKVRSVGEAIANCFELQM